MNQQIQQDYPASNRRKFERVDITRGDHVLVMERNGGKVGELRQIGRGGFMMQSDKSFKDGSVHPFSLHEPEEDIQVEVNARVLYSSSGLVGFEFVELDPDAAVEIGIIIGKYYEHKHQTEGE